MENSTEFTSFILGAYFDSGLVRYLYFSIITTLYIVVVFANTVLIVLIYMETSLHEPMYLFLCSLFVNELYGSTALFPSLMVHLVSDAHAVSIQYCFIQIFCLYTYGSVEYCNLAFMSYDRYLAICYPLQYKIIMTPNRVCVYIGVIWLYSFVKFIITLSLSIRLKLCGNIIDKVYCDNYQVIKLACSDTDTKVNNIYGLFAIIVSVAVPLIPISFSYLKILKISLKGSKETKRKAITTCTPHLASLANFAFGCFFEMLQSRFNMTHIPSTLRIVLSLYFLVCPPLFNPMMYGMRMEKIRNVCKKVLWHEI